MRSIGAGVFELKEADDAGWYRVIYLSKLGNRLYMLHSFVKKSKKTSQNDLKVASNRLRRYEQDCWRTRKMPAKRNEPSHITRGNVFADLGFSSEEAAVLAMKTQLHIEIMKAIKKRGLVRIQVEKLLGVPQPRVSELMSGKISGVTADRLTKYLYRLGREVKVSTKAGERHAAMA